MCTPLEELAKELAFYPHRIVVVAGAGVTLASSTKSDCADWKGLLRHGIRYCKNRNFQPKSSLDVTESLISENKAQSLVTAASRVEEALKGKHLGEYGKWLNDSVGALRPDNPRTINAILRWNVRIATTNYDDLFEMGSHNLLPPVVWSRPDLLLEVLRGNSQGIIHLHGHFRTPESVIFGASGYDQVCQDVPAQNLLRSMFTRDTIVFIGCGAGMNDPNFGSLLKWSEEALRVCYVRHYDLCTSDEAGQRDYKGLPITTIKYGSEYADLAAFLEGLGGTVKELRSSSAVSIQGGLSQSPAFQSHRVSIETEYSNKLAYTYVKLRCTDANGERGSLDDAVDSWRKVLEERPVLYVRGSYGSGKSSFCLHYADYLHRHSDDVRPLLVRLSRCTGSTETNDLKIDLEGIGILSFNEFNKIVEQVKPGEKVLLLLDGLDEPASMEMPSLLKEFRGLKVPTLVTFRDSLFDGEEDALQRFEAWEGRDNFSYLSICPFTPLQREELILAVKGSGDMGEAYRKAISEGLLDSLTRTPVVLTLVLMIPEAELKSVRSTSDIYRLAFEHVVGEAARRMGIAAGQLDAFVKEAAWWMFKSGENSIHPQERRNESPKSPIANLELDPIFTNTGRNDELEFRHRSFREYLVADLLANDLRGDSSKRFMEKGIYFEILQFLSDLIDKSTAWNTLAKWLHTSKDVTNDKKTQLRENCIRLLGQWRDANTLGLVLALAKDPGEAVEHRRDAIRSICRILWLEDAHTEGAHAREMGVVTAWAIRTDRRTYKVGPAKIRVSQFGEAAAKQVGLEKWIPEVRRMFWGFLEKDKSNPDELRLNASFALIHLASQNDIPKFLELATQEEARMNVSEEKSAGTKDNGILWQEMIAVNLWQAVRIAGSWKAQELSEGAQRLLEGL